MGLFLFRGKEVLAMVHLKNGEKVAGMYDEDSFTSSYPEVPEILIEEVWAINDKDEPIEPIQPRRGVIILGSDISRVEFYIWDESSEKKEEGGSSSEQT